MWPSIAVLSLTLLFSAAFFFSGLKCFQLVCANTRTQPFTRVHLRKPHSHAPVESTECGRCTRLTLVDTCNVVGGVIDRADKSSNITGMQKSQCTRRINLRIRLRTGYCHASCLGTAPIRMSRSAVKAHRPKYVITYVRQF